MNNPTLSDVTFLVEGRRFHAHRIALLASSDTFRAMFDGHYREKDASEIPIPNIRYEVFRKMMTCAYTGESSRWQPSENPVLWVFSFCWNPYPVGTARVSTLASSRESRITDTSSHAACQAHGRGVHCCRPAADTAHSSGAVRNCHHTDARRSMEASAEAMSVVRRQRGCAARFDGGAAAGGGPVYAGQPQAPVRDCHRRHADGAHIAEAHVFNRIAVCRSTIHSLCLPLPAISLVR